MGGLLALSRGIDHVNTLIGKSVTWLILVAVLISAGNAVIRKIMDESSNAWLELQWYLYGGAFLLASAYTLKKNEHIRIDIIYGMWSRRVQHWIDLIGHVLFLTPFAVLSVYILWPWVLESVISGEGSVNAGGLALWPAKLLILIGFGLLCAQVVSEIIKKVAIIRGLIDDPHPFHAHQLPIDIGNAPLDETAFANSDDTLSDSDIDHPLDHNGTARQKWPRA